MNQQQYETILAKADDLYYNKRNYHEAEKLYSKVIELNPSDAWAWNSRGGAKRYIGNTKGALEDLSKAIQLEPDNAAFYHNHGNNYCDSGAYDLAIQNYSKALALMPNYNSSLSFHSRGLVYERLGMFDKALSDYKKAVNLDPENTEWRIDLARLYLKLNRFELALGSCCKAFEMIYPNYDPWELVTFIEPNQPDKIAIAYEKVIDAHFSPSRIGYIYEYCIIMPSLDNTIILMSENLHVPDSYKTHIKKNEKHYKLFFDADYDYDRIMDRLEAHHKEKNTDGMDSYKNIHSIINKHAVSIKVVSTSLYFDSELVAGEVGLLAESNKVYLSQTGFHDRSFAGKVQIIYLSRKLAKIGIHIINLGYSSKFYDEYKLSLGATIHTPKEYQELLRRKNYETN